MESIESLRGYYVKGAASEKQMQAVAALNHLELLVVSTGTDVSKVDIREIIGTGNKEDERDILLDKAEVTQRFFRFRDKSKVKRIPDGLSKAQVGKLEEASTTISNAFKVDLEHQVKQAEEENGRLQRRLERAIQHAWGLQKQLNSYSTEGKAHLVGEVEKILADNFWELSSVGAKTITLITREEVQCEIHRDGGDQLRHAGIPDEVRYVNLGRIKAKVDLSNFNVTVGGHSNNLAVGNVAPYISREGSVCWGNASNTAGKFRQTGQVQKLMKLLASLLSNFYTSSHPHRHIVDFYRARVG